MYIKPAFPRPLSEPFGNRENPGDYDICYAQAGMTLLEYYAGQALIGLLSASSEALLNPDKAAFWAFEQAEAMLKESEKVDEEDKKL